MVKILLIDDEPDVIEFQKSYLSRRTYSVFTARNASEAIEIIKSQDPEIIFCDIRLESDTAGFDILKQAKQMSQKSIVYLVTGLTDKETEKQGLALGAREILIKPLTNEMLEQKVREITEA